MTRAVLLTNMSIFDRADPPLAGPLTFVGGLSLFQRTVLTLQRAGISRFLVLAGEEGDVLRRQLEGDPRFTSDVRWLPVREFPHSDSRTWEVISAMLGGPYLLAGMGAIFSVNLVRRLTQEALRGEPVLVASGSQLGEPRSAERVRQKSELHGESGGVMTLEERTSSALHADLIWIPENFTCTGWASAQDYPNPLHAALERGLRQGQVRVLPLGDDWYQHVRIEKAGADDAGTSIAEAEWTLLRSLKGGLEGFVDRHFNRKCSKWITQWLLRTPLTPNAVTILATVVGLIAAGAFAFGGYAAGIVGAVLFQLSAILDCCDGEVARLKFLESPFGEQLDFVLDNVVHVALFAGMAWGAYQAGWGRWALVLGGLAIFGNVAAFGVVQWAMRVRMQADPANAARIDRILNRLASRDFSVLILLLALLGHSDWFLVLAACGSNIFWLFLAWQLRMSAASSRHAA